MIQPMRFSEEGHELFEYDVFVTETGHFYFNLNSLLAQNNIIAEEVIGDLPEFLEQKRANYPNLNELYILSMKFSFRPDRPVELNEAYFQQGELGLSALIDVIQQMHQEMVISLTPDKIGHPIYYMDGNRHNGILNILLPEKKYRITMTLTHSIDFFYTNPQELSGLVSLNNFMTKTYNKQFGITYNKWEEDNPRLDPFENFFKTRNF
jgi:hypothetical protein